MTTNEIAHPRPPAPRRPAPTSVRRTLEDAWRARVDDITRLNTRLLDLQETSVGSSAAAEHEAVAAQLRAAWQAAEQYEHALTRLALGTYGRCQQCREAISPLRLQVLPEASHCAPCQQQVSLG